MFLAYFALIAVEVKKQRHLASPHWQALKANNCFSVVIILWQLLSIKENICPERPRKSHALQDAKKYFFLYITRKMRSTAFQPCITLGGLHWDEMGQKHDFLKKNALKTAFLGDTILDRLTSEGVGSPKKIKNATFLMLSFNSGP